jgi:hypothetical protein
MHSDCRNRSNPDHAARLPVTLQSPAGERLAAEGLSCYNPLVVVNTPQVAIMSARSTILAQFVQVAEEQEKKLAPLRDDLPLLESGLDSLCFAIIVARLEDITGIDPFAVEEDMDFPVTLGDFIRLYDNAAA